MDSHFFATISRMKYIERWALMRSSRPENLSEHAMEVAMIAHALCTIGNIRYGRQLNAERAALIGLYHDASEIITGDMPTPVKYYNRDLKSAYKEVERIAENRLVALLPEDRREAAVKLLSQDPRPGYKRDGARRYGVPFAGYDLRFTVQDGVLRVCEVTPLDEMDGHTEDNA